MVAINVFLISFVMLILILQIQELTSYDFHPQVISHQYSVSDKVEVKIKNSWLVKLSLMRLTIVVVMRWRSPIESFFFGVLWGRENDLGRKKGERRDRISRAKLLIKIQDIRPRVTLTCVY